MSPLLILFGGAALLAAYEAWALFTNRTPTISRYHWELSKQYPVIPFAWGLLMGHFFL